MKSNDIAAIVIISSISVLVAYFVANAVIGSPSDDSVKVKTIAPISANVDTPESSVFNKDAINPTVEVVIGGQTP